MKTLAINPAKTQQVIKKGPSARQIAKEFLGFTPETKAAIKENFTFRKADGFKKNAQKIGNVAEVILPTAASMVISGVGAIVLLPAMLLAATVSRLAVGIAVESLKKEGNFEKVTKSVEANPLNIISHWVKNA